MSRKSKHPITKPSPPKQLLPFRDKIVPNPEFSKMGLTDQFYRFRGSRMSGFILREVFVPGGNVYHDKITPETVALREKELRKYAESASKHGISVVNHTDFLAQRTLDEPIKFWTLADKVPGNATIHDLFIARDPRAFEHQKRVMRASADYCIGVAKDATREVVATDLQKPSQFIVGEDGDLTMVDTNPTLWGRFYGVDDIMSEIFMQAMAMNLLTQDPESVDIGIGAITTLADTGLVDGSISIINETTLAIQNYPPDHPQILLMQKAGLALLLEQPIQ